MSTAMTIRDKQANIRALIERSKGQIALALPKHMTPERMIRVVNTAISKTPKLLEADPRSLMGAIIQSSQLGLEPDGVLGHAYLVPFNNRKSGKVEVQFIAGYKGLIELSRRSGQISTIYAHVVHENDDFHYTLGLEPTLVHQPTSEEPGLPVAVYAVCRLRDGGAQFEVLWKREVEAVRKQSMAGNAGPWVSHWEEMAKKTALRRLCKLLPTSPELARAVALDEMAEASVPQHLDLMADGQGGQLEGEIEGEAEVVTPEPGDAAEPEAEMVAEITTAARRMKGAK